MTRTVDDVLADYRVIFSGRTRYEGQEPRDDELLAAEIDRLRNAELACRYLVVCNDGFWCVVNRDEPELIIFKAPSINRDVAFIMTIANPDDQAIALVLI